MPSLTLLLPPRSRFAGHPLAPALARALGRADRLPDGQAGERAQLQRHCELLPRGWPAAAITRAVDAGDAALGRWLRADPAQVRADHATARLIAYGPDLRLTAEEAAAFLHALKPLFGDAGCPISAPVPDRWYLMLPRESKLPEFSDPERALGEDLLAHLPEGPLGQRWRSLLNEAQVIVHNHPRNAERLARGLPAVNSLWFWGAGVLPDQVRLPASRVYSDEALPIGLARLAGVTDLPLPPAFAAMEMPADAVALADLRSRGDGQHLQRDWLLPALDSLGPALSELHLDFADGRRYRLTRRQRWRLWRKPADSMAADARTR